MVEALNFLFDESSPSPSQTSKHKSLKSYYIVCDGISSGKLVYLQDKRKGGYWTEYKDNARVFTASEAIDIVKHLRYNNPRLIERR